MLQLYSRKECLLVCQFRKWFVGSKRRNRPVRRFDGSIVRNVLHYRGRSNIVVSHTTIGFQGYRNGPYVVISWKQLNGLRNVHAGGAPMGLRATVVGKETTTRWYFSLFRKLFAGPFTELRLAPMLESSIRDATKPDGHVDSTFD